MTIFSDRGAWYGWEWGDGPALAHVNLPNAERRPLRLSSPPVWRSIGAEEMTARLEDGSRLSLRYVDARACELTIAGGASLLGVPAIESGLYRFEDERIEPGVGEDLAGIPVTLRRNWRVPGKPMPAGGIVPSPFATQELRAYDAFFAAAALPTPLATKLLRAVFAGQDADGSLPGAGEMPLAAWACSTHPGLLEDFRPELTAHARWWEETRRHAEIVPVAVTAGYCRERRLLGRPDEAAEADIDGIHFIDGEYRDCVRADPTAVQPTGWSSWAPLACGLAAQSRAERIVAIGDREDPIEALRFEHEFLTIEALARYGRAPYAEVMARRLLTIPGDWEAVDPESGDPVPGARPQTTVAAAVRAILAERYAA